MSAPGTPQPPMLSEREREIERKKERRLIWLIVGGVVGLIVVGVVALVMGILHFVGSSEPVRLALAEVNQCAPCRDAIGTPIEKGWFITGQVNWSGDEGDANLRIPVNGPRGSGMLSVEALRGDGEWRFVELFLDIPEKQRHVVLWHEGKNVTPSGVNVASAGGGR